MAFLNIKSKYKSLSENQQNKIIVYILVVPVVLVYLFAFFYKANKAAFLLNDTLLYFLVFFIAAISLDLEVGTIGLPNFGKVGFIALGAYVTTIVLNQGLFGDVFTDFFFGVFIAMIVSAFFGWLIAIPSVKLRADYFAIMTIAGGEVIRIMLQNEKRYFWRTSSVIKIGDKTIPIKEPLMLNSMKKELSEMNFFGFEMSQVLDLGSFGSLFLWQIFLFFFFLTFGLIVYAFIQVIRKSPYGRALRAIREDDITVTSVGKDVFRFRWQVTVIAAVVCSVSGSLFAVFNSAFEPLDFRPIMTFNLFVFIIIGGIGNSRGAAFGTLLITMFLRASEADAVKRNLNFSIDEGFPLIGKLLTDLQIRMDISSENLRFVILGTILILFLLYKPSGVIPEPKSNNEKYLSLLSADERRDSDDAIDRRQSSAEKDRILIENNELESENSNSEEL